MSNDEITYEDIQFIKKLTEDAAIPDPQYAVISQDAADYYGLNSGEERNGFIIIIQRGITDGED